MSIFIDEKLRQETRMIATETPAGIVMIENTLDDCNKVTNMCSGGPECPVRRFSLFNNGKPGKPHWAGAKENLVMNEHNGAFYNLRFRKDDGALHKATRVGLCTLVTLERGKGRIGIKDIKGMEKYTGELIEVLILFGDYLSTFKTVWSLTTDMDNKKAFNEFFSKVEDEDWASLIAFVGTPEFRKSVPKIRGEDRFAFQQRLKEKQLACLEVIEPMIDHHHRMVGIEFKDLYTLQAALSQTKINVKTGGNRGETAFPPMRATEAQINAFLGLENDPIHLTKQFKEMRESAAKGGSLSTIGTLTISDEDYEQLPRNRPFERDET